jgi:DNA-binding transcriptional LysR family regulator
VRAYGGDRVLAKGEAQRYAKDLVLAGAGIAYIFEPLVRAEIREGRLQSILPEAATEEPGPT